MHGNMMKIHFSTMKHVLDASITTVFFQTKTCSTQSSTEKEKEIDKIKQNASLDEPPTSCCQSGCANCVFIVWAEALSKKMENVDPVVAEKILDMVQDPCMKAFLEMELKIRGLKKT